MAQQAQRCYVAIKVFFSTVSASSLIRVRDGAQSQWPDLGVGLIAGVLATMALKDSLADPATWGAILVSAVVGFLLTYWIRRQLFLPSSGIELASAEASALAQSIQRAQHASYAVSSDWIDLWRSDAFTYYLSLDQVSSLAIYTRTRHSPLAGLSDATAEREHFIAQSRKLMRDIGAGRIPVGEHRIRILIYPREVYDEYRSRVIALLRLHSAGRIPCLPLVSEDLANALTNDERNEINQFTRNQLRQDLQAKLPPQPPHKRRGVRKLAARPDMVLFPDLLLIDPGDAADGQMWWYTGGRVTHVEARNSATAVGNAESVFRTLCRRGESAIWANFTADNVGNVPVTTRKVSSAGELFFALDYYQQWLAWIEASAATDPDAQTLSGWLQEEDNALESFVEANQNPDGSLAVLDVGCGFGRHLLNLARRHSSLTGVGIDVIAGMVAGAARSARVQSYHERLYFCEDTSTELATCRDGEFDVAICMTNTLGNMERATAEEALRQIHRCLKPGGRLLVSVYSAQSVVARLASYRKVRLHVKTEGKQILAAEGLESAYFDQQELRQLLSNRGFEVLQVTSISSVGFAVEATRSD